MVLLYGHSSISNDIKDDLQLHLIEKKIEKDDDNVDL